MEVGEIINAAEYNKTQLNKFHKDFKKADGYEPQVAFYCFFNKFGNFRNYGFVGKTKRGVIWDKTKKAVKERLLKEKDLNKSVCFSVNSKDLFNEEKNPNLSLSAKDILNNPNIAKRQI